MFLELISKEYATRSVLPCSQCSNSFYILLPVGYFFLPQSCLFSFFPGLQSEFLRSKHIHGAGQCSEVAFSSWMLSGLVWPVRICTNTLTLSGCFADWLCHRLTALCRPGGFGEASNRVERPFSKPKPSSSSWNSWLFPKWLIERR